MLNTFIKAFLCIVIAVQNSSLAQISTFDKSPFTSGTTGAFASTYQTNQPSSIPSSIRTLISSFNSAVDSSPILPDVFTIGQVDIHAFAHFLYNAMYTQVTRGFYDPHDLVSYVYQPITEKSTIVNYPMLVNMYANTMGNLLLAEKMLNDSNAATLGYALAKEMEVSAQKVGGLAYPEAKFQALADGFINILQSKGLFTEDKLHVAGRYLAKEIRLASGGSDTKAAGHRTKDGHNKYSKT